MLFCTISCTHASSQHRHAIALHSCEMLYILDQRLKAQNIAADKSCRVLHDVVRTMFDPQVQREGRRGRGGGR